MKRKTRFLILGMMALTVPTVGLLAEETVATALYARVGNGYKREKAKDGSFKPEYYALSNGGRIYGTTGDITVDRITYPQVAEIAMRLLTQQNYHYAERKEQAGLLLVLQWGSTIAPNGINNMMNIQAAGAALEILTDMKNRSTAAGNGAAGFGPSPAFATSADTDASLAAAEFESAMARLLADNRVRDQLNEKNARVLGYLDDLADSNDIRRWAGGGDRYTDLITDVEETRYYIVISAYDFPELLKNQKKQLLWQTRVSVRSPGNTFDDSFVAMLKSASKYFGQDSGKLIRGEESKGTVELGDLKFLGEAKERAKENPETKK